MNKHIRSATLLLIAALAPVSVSAELIFSDVEYTAFTSATTQLLPEVTDFDSTTVPIFSPASVQALSQPTVFSMGFPNIPNSVGSAFASAAQLTFRLERSKRRRRQRLLLRKFPSPERLGSINDVLANPHQQFHNRDQVPDRGLLRPHPDHAVLRRREFLSPGVDPARDAFASVEARAITKITHPNGSIVENIVFDYGMRTLRSPPPGLPGSGVFMVVPLSPSLWGSRGLTHPTAPSASGCRNCS